MQITLSVIAGPHKGQSFSFEEHDTFFVGRSERANLQISKEDRHFSRLHFLVELNPPACRLVDMKSRNGTYVNDLKVKIADLHDGDRIKAGRTVFTVGISEPKKTVPPILSLPEERIVLSLPEESLPPRPVARRNTPVPPVPEVPYGSRLRISVCWSCGNELDKGGSERKAEGDDMLTRICPACRQLNEHKKPDPAVHIPGYRLVRELGRGGMGVVHLALREKDQSPVALKTILPKAGNENDLKKFVDEATILRRLDHPNIVAFREMGTANGQAFFVMDFVRGNDADSLIKDNSAMPIARAVGIICQVLEALKYAHSSDIVHRDIKPANILVTKIHGNDRVLLADFGLARQYQASKISGYTRTESMGGSPLFMPPEQITRFRHAKPPADQYSSAATLYYLLSGKYLFDGFKGVIDLLLMIADEPPVPIRNKTRRPDVPHNLADAIHKALAKIEENRFAHIEEFQNALLPFAVPEHTGKSYLSA